MRGYIGNVKGITTASRRDIMGEFGGNTEGNSRGAVIGEYFANVKDLLTIKRAVLGEYGGILKGPPATSCH